MVRALILACLCVICGWMNIHAQVTQPLVAVHDSELTRALENMAAVPPTPTGAGTTGKQWWTPDWHYFVMPESVKEALRSDGTAFTVIGDSNVTAGVLLTNGQPRYPIVVSFASEAVRDDEIAPFTNYVAAGGFLLVGSSSFSRNTNGTTRGDFAFANQLGLHFVSATLQNWSINNNVTKVLDHRLDSHFPAGQLTWRMPTSSEEIPWGVSPDHPYLAPHDVWRVTTSDATVLIQGDSYPFLTVKPYGKGYFIYCAAFQPLMGHSGFAPSTYAYVIFRRAIEWAFETLSAPVPRLSPWPYQYDSALMVRHDLENFTNEIAAIESSAQMEFTNGTKGDYYFCTGTLRDDASPAYPTNGPTGMIAGLRRAVTNYGATIGPHNGGLKNPGNTNLVRGQYDYWHWGTDEVLDLSPAGYANGKAYATASISNSFRDVESWLNGITNGLRSWVQCYFNGTREDSYDLQAQLNVKISGDQKISPFPHWTLSTLTPNKRYSFLTEPVSDWFVNGLVAQSLEPWHPPGVQTTNTLHAAIDFYYNLGALINFYSHSLSTGLGDAGGIATEYVIYSLNTNLHPRIWPANGLLVYQWWLQRSNVQVTASWSTNGNQTLINLSIAGSSNTNTAVEVLIPGTNNPPCSIQVVTNGVLAGTNTYRIVNGQTLRLRVGTSVTNAIIGYYPMPFAQLFAENFDGLSPPALPAGWSTSASGAQSNWVTRAGTNFSAPNAVFSPDATNAGVNELVSPSIVLGSGPGLLSFMHYYDLEPGTTGDAFDGGVLEIKIGTNAFTDIITAGGSFILGGYVTNINSSFGNPLAGRQAWTGNSGGFTQTLVNLPASASGTNIQFKWRCASDNNNGRTGWWIDSVSVSNRVCLCCLPPNNPPVLPAQADRIIPQQTLLTVTNTATDPDGNNLSYQLSNPPVGATISTNGIISWTPSGAQAPGIYTITTIVTDNGFPPLSTNNSFVVTVKGVPVFGPTPTNRTVAPLTALTITNSATDPNTPTNTLTYSLLAPPAGASISPTTGVIMWTPSTAQDQTTNTIRTVVSNDVWPSLTTTNSFTVIINGDPVLALNSATLVQENCLATNNVIDPGETVTVLFSLKNNGLGNTTNLVAALLQTNGVVASGSPQNYGAILAGGAPVTQPFTFANTGSCGSSITAVLQLQDGARNFGLISNTFVLGPVVTIFTQSFDTVTAPALPAGWTTSASGAQSLWFTTNTVADTPPNAAFSTDATNIGVNELVSPQITLPNGPAQLSFRHSYSFESDLGIPTNGFDGGVLEIQIGTNAFTDITNGGSWVANGYNRKIDSRYGNPLTNRWAWSGTNGGYVTTTVNLPVAALGQPVQFRWRVGADNSNPGGGWRIDTISITGYACCANTAPVLAAQTDRTVPELTLLTVTNTATDPSSPGSSLTYSLVSPPSGAAIDSNGIITWTPTEAQGPGVYTITTIVSDNAYSPLTATNSFAVTVTEVNAAPSLTVPADQIINELTTLNVSASATDSDIPPNNLTFSLVSAPSGVTINTNTGAISWTPTEAQGPSTNMITVRVTDDGTPNLSDTKSFTVIVNEVNSPPVLTVPPDQTINELTTLNVSASATDPDIPANVLTFSLLSAPAGMVINTNSGAISWTPSEAQGPSTNIVTVRVTDDGTPNLTDTKSFTVIVNEVNSAPALTVPADQTINELATLNVSASATDSDTPTNNLAFSLVSAPSGMTINTNTGAISWTPTEAQGPSTNTITVRVTDDGTPNLSDTKSFTVIVNEVNSAPVLTVPTNQVMDEMTTLNVSASATDADIPTNTLVFSLLSPPAGMTINTNTGAINWTPTEAQGPSTNQITVVVTDDGTPSLSATNTFTVVVNEINTPPLLPAQTNQTIIGTATLVVTNTATDSDIPVNTLTYFLLVAPTNAVIDTNGIITWTPTIDQIPSTNLVTTVVTDNNPWAANIQQLSATNTFTVIVNASNQSPVLPFQPDRTVPSSTTMIVTNTATDPDIPPNRIYYTLSSAPAGASIDTNGIITWTSPSSSGLLADDFVTVATDDGIPPLSTTNRFTVTVVPPAGPPLILSVRLTNGVATLSWSSVPGHTYQLEYKDNFTATNWIPILPTIPASNSTTTATNAVGDKLHRFYRVSLLP